MCLGRLQNSSQCFYSSQARVQCSSWCAIASSASPVGVHELEGAFLQANGSIKGGGWETQLVVSREHTGPHVLDVEIGELRLHDKTSDTTSLVCDGYGPWTTKRKGKGPNQEEVTAYISHMASLCLGRGSWQIDLLPKSHKTLHN